MNTVKMSMEMKNHQITLTDDKVDDLITKLNL